MIISLPVHTAVGKNRPAGAPVVLVAVQLSVPGLYLPPLFKRPPTLNPPQTIISLPLHTAFGSVRALGAPMVLVAVQLSVPGSYLPPVLK
jgi:hypothetical protein